MALSCTSPEVVENGYVSFESLASGPTWNDGEYVVYKCFKFYGLAETDRRKCDNGGWSGTAPKCEYHQETEIVFWLVLALLILLLLLLLALVIFTCCYFCRCCKRHGRSRDKDNANSGSRKKRNSESSNRTSHNDEKPSRRKDDKEEALCCPGCCCPTKKETRTKTHGRPKSANRSRSESPERENHDGKLAGTCCAVCCVSTQKTETPNRDKPQSFKNGHRSKSQVNEEHDNIVNEYNGDVKPGCCACCNSKPTKKQVNETQHVAYDEVTPAEKKKNCQECLDPEPEMSERGTNTRAERAKESKSIRPSVETKNPVYAGYSEDPDIELVEEENDTLRKQQKQIQDEKDKEIQRVQEERKIADERKKEIEHLREEEMEKDKKCQKDLEEQKAKFDDQRQQKLQEQEFARLQAERERKHKEEEHQQEIEDQLRKERIEQQKRYEEERLNALAKQKEKEAKEREEELERQRLREYERQRQLEIIEREHQLQVEKQKAEKEKRESEERQKEQKRQLEEKKREKEQQKLQQQELARQLAEQHKKEEWHRRNELFQKEQDQLRREESHKPEPYLKQTRKAPYSSNRANYSGGNEPTSTETGDYKHQFDNLKRKRPLKLINSNDKYLKGLMDDDIGKKGTRNPKVYNPFKSHKGSEVPTTYDMYGHASDTPGRTRYSDNNIHSNEGQKKPLKLINSNDKFVRGMVDDSVGRRATKNPLVYRPYKLEKPSFTDKS